MLTKDRRAKQERTSSLFPCDRLQDARSNTIPIVEKFVERAKAVCESTPVVHESTPRDRPYRTAEIAVSRSRELVRRGHGVVSCTVDWV